MMTVFALFLSLASAVERTPLSATLETDWIQARETGMLPAALGLRPERLNAFVAESPPHFVTDCWYRYANDLTRELYVAFTLARADFARAAHLEARRALSTLALLNVEAQNPCIREGESCRRILRAIVEHAVQTAWRQVPCGDADQTARMRAVLSYLAERGSSNRALGLATAAAKARWAKSDLAAKDRWTQAFIGLGVFCVLEGAVLSSPGEYQNEAQAVMLTGSSLLALIFGDGLPLTSEFNWSTNHVGAAVVDCERLLDEKTE